MSVTGGITYLSRDNNETHVEVEKKKANSPTGGKRMIKSRQKMKAFCTMTVAVNTEKKGHDEGRSMFYFLLLSKVAAAGCCCCCCC